MYEFQKRIMVYNGDTDPVIPYNANQWFLDDLNLTVLCIIVSFVYFIAFSSLLTLFHDFIYIRFYL